MTAVQYILCVVFSAHRVYIWGVCVFVFMPESPSTTYKASLTGCRTRQKVLGPGLVLPFERVDFLKIDSLICKVRIKNKSPVVARIQSRCHMQGVGILLPCGKHQFPLLSLLTQLSLPVLLLHEDGISDNRYAFFGPVFYFTFLIISCGA